MLGVEMLTLKQGKKLFKYVRMTFKDLPDIDEETNTKNNLVKILVQI